MRSPLLIVPALLAIIVTQAGAQVVLLDELPAEDGPEAPELPTPAELIERSIEVSGGRDAWEGVRNRRFTGRFQQGGGGPVGITILQSAPNNRHVTVERAGGGATIFVTNADASWTYDGDVVVAAGGDQLVQEIRRAVFDWQLDWASHYELARTLGLEDVAGRPAWKVRLTAEDCHKVFLYFDRETGRFVRTTQEIAYAGETIDSDTTFGEWKMFDGIEIATRVRRVIVVRGNRQVQNYAYDRVEHNVEMDESLFETPSELG